MDEEPIDLEAWQYICSFVQMQMETLWEQEFIWQIIESHY